ncbi:MAG: helix-turn-helix domain-containing protein [Candidatus Shapirobacteria bacterium]
MKTAGEVLRAARQEKNWNLQEVARETKIREQFLKALEENDYSQLLSATSARGFLKNYAEYLGLAAEPLLALLRRDYQKGEEKEGVPVGWRKAVDQSRGGWRGRWLVAGILIGLAFYLVRQYFLLAKGPYLEVWSPQGGEEVLVDRIEVAGRTDVDALVTVNDQPVILNQQGEFHYFLDLFSEENQITIRAKGRNGQESVKQKAVFRLDK